MPGGPSVASSLMAFTTWTCTICSLLMAVEDGPAHIGSDNHKARLAQFNASTLASRVKELTLLYSSFSKVKKRVLTLPPQTSIPTSQFQAISRIDTCPPQVNRKLWNRFYEPLILLLAYGKSQGEHVKLNDASSEGDLGGSNNALCKKFLDELAYMCDYSPSGDTVAAIAIQDGPQPTYWVAANASQGSKVKPFLSNILQLLAQVYEASEEHVVKLERQISDCAILFSAQRLQRYKSKLKRTVKDCLLRLGGDTEDADILKEWLILLKGSELDLPNFCLLCYKARDSTFLKAVKQNTKGSSLEKSTSFRAQYARIRHFIGRLGSHINASSVLVEAGRHCPKLFLDYSIEIAMHRLNFTPPSYRTKSSINSIINRMVTNPQACDYYQKELYFQDEKFHLELEKRIRDKYKNPKFKLRTHAEIILLDLFHHKNLRFLDGIRYIGVSKPACFLCYRYFQAHPLQVQISGCSNNLYIQWQPPYILEDSPALIKEQEDILNTMIKGIRLFVLDKIVPDYRGVRSHPDSTTGLGTSVYADDIGAPTDAHNDLHPAMSALPYHKERSYRLELTSTSNEAMKNWGHDSVDWETAGVADKSDQDSNDDGGVSLF